MRWEGWVYGDGRENGESRGGGNAENGCWATVVNNKKGEGGKVREGEQSKKKKKKKKQHKKKKKNKKKTTTQKRKKRSWTQRPELEKNSKMIFRER